MTSRMEVAERFAESLDREDYETASRLLHDDCVYTIGGQVHRGKEAILASYRKAGDWVAENLDAVRYESSVRPSPTGGATVDFVDHLEHAGERLTHRCEQHLELDAEGKIVSIRHVDPPGEAEAVRAFLERVGVARP